MTSWRDSASGRARDDLDGLVDEALPIARDLLSKHGEFFPYAVSLNLEGEATVVAGDPGEGEHPASADVLRTLVSGLTRERASLRAVAVVSDVRVSGTDAVRVELEHSDGHALAVFLPYVKKRLRGLRFGDPAAGPSVPQVWT